MILALCAVGLFSFCQTKLEEDLKKFVLEETESYMRGDSVKWASFFSHGDKVFRTYTGNGFHSSQTGWKNFGPFIIEWMRGGLISKIPTRLQHENYVIRTSGDLSWMSYEQKRSIVTVIVCHSQTRLKLELWCVKKVCGRLFR